MQHLTQRQDDSSGSTFKVLFAQLAVHLLCLAVVIVLASITVLILDLQRFSYAFIFATEKKNC